MITYKQKCKNIKKIMNETDKLDQGIGYKEKGKGGKNRRRRRRRKEWSKVERRRKGKEEKIGGGEEKERSGVK